MTSSNSSENGNFVRTTLQSAALAAMIATGTAQAQENNTQIDTARDGTKEKVEKTINHIGFSQAEIIAANTAGQGIFVKKSSPLLAGINDAPKNTMANTSQTHTDGANVVQQIANQEIQKTFGTLSGIEYSKEFGPIVNFGFQTTSDGDSSLVFLGKAGKKEKEFLLGYGLEIDSNSQIFFSGEHLQQKSSFGATGQSYTVDQNKAGLKFRYVPKTDFVKNIELNGKYSQSADVTVGERYKIINDALIFDQTLIQDGFIGASQAEALLSGTFDVGAHGEIIIDG